jgi:hypothetical protein
MKTIIKIKNLSRETKHEQKIFPIDDVGAFGDNGTMCIIGKTKGREGGMVGPIQF